MRKHNFTGEAFTHINFEIVVGTGAGSPYELQNTFSSAASKFNNLFCNQTGRIVMIHKKSIVMRK